MLFGDDPLESASLRSIFSFTACACAVQLGETAYRRASARASARAMSDNARIRLRGDMLTMISLIRLIGSASSAVGDMASSSFAPVRSGGCPG